MPKVKFSREDLLKGTQLDAQWYPLLLKEVTEGPGKKDPTSTVWACKFIVASGPKEGTPVQHWFSEKQMERVAAFIKCFTSDISTEKDYELEDAIDRPVLGYVHYDAESRWNTIEDFRPASGGAK